MSRWKVGYNRFLRCQNYETNVSTVMINNSINIKRNNYLSSSHWTQNEMTICDMGSWIGKVIEITTCDIGSWLGRVIEMTTCDMGSWLGKVIEMTTCDMGSWLGKVIEMTTCDMGSWLGKVIEITTCDMGSWLGNVIEMTTCDMGSWHVTWGPDLVKSYICGGVKHVNFKQKWCIMKIKFKQWRQQHHQHQQLHLT
jgi:hypothetical protein